MRNTHRNDNSSDDSLSFLVQIWGTLILSKISKQAGHCCRTILQNNYHSNYSEISLLLHTVETRIGMILQSNSRVSNRHHIGNSVYSISIVRREMLVRKRWAAMSWFSPLTNLCAILQSILCIIVADSLTPTDSISPNATDLSGVTANAVYECDGYNRRKSSSLSECTQPPCRPKVVALWLLYE